MVISVCRACGSSLSSGDFHCQACGSTDVGAQTVRSEGQSGFGSSQNLNSRGVADDYNYATFDQATNYGSFAGASASRWMRLGDYLLDAVLNWATFGIGWLAWLAIISPRGLTPSKQIMGLQVVDSLTGLPAIWWKVWLRHYVPLLLSMLIAPFTIFGWLSLPFSLAFVLTIAQVLAYGLPFIDAVFIFGSSRQRLMDKLFKTAVIRTR